MQCSEAHVSSILRRPLRLRPSIKIKIAAGWLLSGPHFAAAFSSRDVSSSSHKGRLNSLWRTSPPALSFSAPSRNYRGPMSSHSTSDDGDGPSPLPTTWSDLMSTNSSSSHWDHATRLFPPLTASSHKGSHGRIAVLGGSEKYTGAPYYAAQAALHCGVDLATVFCAEEASVPIKCYSPELMVQGVYSVEELDTFLREEQGLLEEREQCKQRNDLMTNELNELELLQTMEKLERSEEKQLVSVQRELENDDTVELLVERLGKMKQIEEKLQRLRERQEIYVGSIVDTVTSVFPSLHVLCIGPGLGRHPLVFSAVAKVIHKAIECNLSLVLDADALFMLSLEEYRGLFEILRYYDRCVMTPNLMEMKRLDQAEFRDVGVANIEKSDGKYCNILIQKGSVDTIRHIRRTMQCKEDGGLKRSGGIGDVLAGTISAFVAWNVVWEKNVPDDYTESKVSNRQHHQRIFASWAACCVVKKGTNVAFQKKRRAMSAMDVIGEMGNVLESMEGELTLALSSQMQQPKSS